MADTTALKNRIRAAIKANDNQEITGPVLQQTLLDIVDELSDRIIDEYVLIGIAVPTTIPPSNLTEYSRVFYLTAQNGVYTNLGGIEVSNEIAIIKYNGTSWLKDTVIAIDETPTAGSDNLVKSKGVFNTIQSLPVLEHAYNIVNNSYTDNGGIVENYPGFHRTDYINVYFLKTINIDANAGSSYNTWFNADKEPISAFSVTSGNHEYDVPENAAFLVCSCSSSTQLPSIEDGEHKSFIPVDLDLRNKAYNGDYINKELSNELIPYTIVAGEYIDLDGSIKQSQGFSRTNYLSVPLAKSINVTMSGNSSYCHWFDKNKQPLSDGHFWYNTNILEYEAPNGAEYVIISSTNENIATLQLSVNKFNLRKVYDSAQQSVETNPILYNGVPWNNTNTKCVCSKYINCKNGDIVVFDITKNAPAGFVYRYGYAIYSSTYALLSYLSPQDINNSKNYVIVNDADAKWLKITIAIYNINTLKDGVLRISEVDGATTFLTQSDVTVNVYSYPNIYCNQEMIDVLINKINYLNEGVANCAYPTIQNGAPWNSSNPNSVRPIGHISCSVGDRIKVSVLKEPPVGYYYSCTFALYDSNNSIVEYSELSGCEHKVSNKNVSYCNIAIYICSLIDGAVGVIRISDTGTQDLILNTNDVAINVLPQEESIKELSNNIKEIESSLKLNAYHRNVDKEPMLLASCNYRSVSQGSKDYVALLLSDPHADSIAIKNAVDVANGFRAIDALICLGDIVQDHYGQDYLPTYNEIVAKCYKPVYNIIGNHDAGETDYVGMSATHQQLYDALVKPMIDRGFLNVGEYTENKNWWYHDIATQKIRLIAIYEYDEPLELDTTKWNPIAYDSSYGDIRLNTNYSVGDKVNVPNYTDYSFECVTALTTPNSTYDTSHNLPSYKIIRGRKVIMQEQAQWFLNTLCSTPQDYTVVLLAHGCITSQEVAQSQLKFSQNAQYADTLSLMQSEFLGDAIKAFVDGENFSMNVVMKDAASYLNTQGGGTYAYSVSKDFSQKNSGVKFLCAVTGHAHRDLIYKDATRGIYDIKPTTANTVNYAQMAYSDIKRTSEDGYAKDSLTSISFHDDNSVSLVKIGANVTTEMTYRDIEKVSFD